MQSAAYYREQAKRARRLARSIDDTEARAALRRAARDYDQIAEDLERGLIDITDPGLLPQQQHPEDG